MQPIIMIMIYYWDKKLKKVSCPGSWYNNNWKKLFDVSCSRNAFFSRRVPNDRHFADDTLEFVERSCQSPRHNLFSVSHEISDWWLFWVQQWIIDCSHTRCPSRTCSDKYLRDSDQVSAETSRVRDVCWSADVWIEGRATPTWFWLHVELPYLVWTIANLDSHHDVFQVPSRPCSAH